MTHLLLVSLLAATSIARAEPSRGYYRYPALHDDTIVFAAEGDLWTVGTEGGMARRITTHPSEESRPCISPDGTTLAFTARYEGPAELYTMPLAGGLPTRRTYEAESSAAVGWTPDGKVIYSTSHFSTLPSIQLVTLELKTGKQHRVPLSQASDGCYDATGGTLYFARPSFHGNETKRYKGGTARNIWKFSERAEEAENMTADYPGENHSPMWWDGRVYFVCDRDGTMNIWSMDEDGRDVRQHTDHMGWDVKSPGLSRGKIVYQLGADLRLLDIATGFDRLVPITLASDFDQLREKWVKKPMDYMTSVRLHPNGESVVLTARGRVFVAPSEQGRLVRVSREPGVRYRDVCFMPDGKTLLALSDATGELEFCTVPANGVGAAKALTDDGTVLRYRGHPSPDGKWIAYSDKNNDLWVLEVETGDQKRISANREGVGEIAWSPDSRWIAYSMCALNTYYQIYLYNIEEGSTTALTTDRVNSMSPAWDPDGKWIYFVSDRSLRSVVTSPWGPRQPEPFFDKTVKIYHISLRKGLRSPFKPSDELYRAEAKKQKEKEQKEKEEQQEEEEDGQNDEHQDDKEPEDKKDAAEKTEIELDGIESRIKVVPVSAGNYRSLSVNDKTLFWVSEDRGLNGKRHLMALEIDNKDVKPVRLLDDVKSYELSADGKKLLVHKAADLFVFDASSKPPSKLSEKKVKLDGWTFPIDVREDWRQIFVDAWRLERDYFYDPGMHGVDWPAMLDKYMPLVDRVTTRAELSDVIGQMVGELSALHTTVRGGDHRQGPDQIKVATLGARLGRDEDAGGYRIEHIYRSDPDYPELLSPLADPDLEIEVGDIIESINGVEILAVPDPDVLLRNQQGRQVLVRVKSVSSGESRDLIVTPTDSEYDLRYRDWEYTRRLMVEEASAGTLGYVHLRAMGGSNLAEWYRNYYPIFNRQGLIIDMRHNRGGNIDSIILEKLLRRAWFYWQPRVGETTWNMHYAFRGHMVVLCDEMTASDGEAFTEGFKRLGLGKVIGTRTWGGEIWLSYNNRLSDGGIATAAQTGVYGPEGEWLIEGHGVEPDIVVDNLPRATFKGEDAQLDAAIDYLMEKVREEPVPVPPRPAYPDKSFRGP